MLQKIEIIKIGDKIRGLKKLIESIPDGEYEITIKNKKYARSIEQNRKYFALLSFLEKFSGIGYTKDEWHEIFKYYFLREMKDGKIPYEIQKSSTELNTEEFSEFITKVLVYIKQEFNIDDKEIEAYKNGILNY